jgi:hypothetical protein
MTSRLIALVVAAATAAACTAPPAGTSAEAPAAPAPAAGGDAAARWFAHVEFLADDDMRGRETGSPEHRKAADYVAAQLERAGVEPAGIAGFMQPVTFRSRRIVEEKSRLALVRRGKEVPVVLGDEATFSMRIDAAPQVEAPLVFAGHGLVIPELDHNDFAGLT